MLWDVRARMLPALSVIDLIPHVHRTAALALLRRAITEGRPATLPLDPDSRGLAFHDAPVALISPIGARVLLALYRAGQIKLKKPGAARLPALEAYCDTEAAFRAEVAAIVAADQARQDRLAQIVADPSSARAEELSAALIDRVMTARLGHGAAVQMQIAGLTCHRDMVLPAPEAEARLRAEPHSRCWWIDARGQRQGQV